MRSDNLEYAAITLAEKVGETRQQIQLVPKVGKDGKYSGNLSIMINIHLPDKKTLPSNIVDLVNLLINHEKDIKERINELENKLRQQ